MADAPRPRWTAPPAKSPDSTNANLWAAQNGLFDYLATVGLMPSSPASLSTCFGWWSAQAVPANINDLSGAFTSSDSASVVPDLSRVDGRTLAGTAVSGTWGVASNQLYCSSGAGLYQWDIGKADATLQADVTYSSNAASIVFRYVDASNYLEVQFGGFAMRVRKTVAGVATTLASSATYSPTSGVQATLRVVLSGATVSVYGVDAGGTLPSTPTITYTLTSGEQTTFLAPTKVGFLASANTSRYDNLSVALGLSDGDRVGLLTDQSYAGTNLAQAAAANMPSYAHVAGYQRERAMLLFNGGNINLASQTFAAKTGPKWVTGVFYLPAATANDTLLAGQAGAGNVRLSSANKLYTNGANGLVAPYANVNPAGPYVVTSVLNGTASSLRVNGAPVVTGNAGAASMTQFYWGAPSSGIVAYSSDLAVGHGTGGPAEALLCERYFAQLNGINLGV